MTKKAFAVLAVIAVAIGITVGAYAYWTAGGSGTGTGTAGNVTGITVHQTSSVTNLYPDGPAQALSGDFTNSNDSAVYVHSVSASVSSTSDSGCTAADFEIAGTALVDAEVAVGAHKGSWSGLTIKMLDRTVNQDACKGVTVNLSYTSN